MIVVSTTFIWIAFVFMNSGSIETIGFKNEDSCIAFKHTKQKALNVSKVVCVKGAE